LVDSQPRPVAVIESTRPAARAGDASIRWPLGACELVSISIWFHFFGVKGAFPDQLDRND